MTYIALDFVRHISQDNGMAIPSTKLTLRLEEALIKKAKAYGRRSGKSVSQMVSDYFRFLGNRETIQEELAPITRSLRGSLRKSRVSMKDYRRHLEEKYL